MSEKTNAENYFEAPAWNERYSGGSAIWSGAPNPQLVEEVSRLRPGTALDVGCGEGGDVIWLARQGWRVTGADFSETGLARAANNATEAGVDARTEWWRIDAREFDSEGRTWDLVTTHFLHPPGGRMAEVATLLAGAVAPGGHLLVVGHSPNGVHVGDDERRRAMFVAADLVPALPQGFEPVIVEQRPRTVDRAGTTIEIEDSTLMARRVD